MNDETRDKDKSITLSGPVVNLIVSSILGALLGGTGMVAYQKYEQGDKAPTLSVAEHKWWEDEINRQARELYSLSERIRQMELNCRDTQGEMKSIKEHIAECSSYRQKDEEAMNQLRIDILHDHQMLERSVDRNIRGVEKNLDLIQELQKK